MELNGRNDNAQRRIAPVHLVWNGEMSFDAPIERVWGHLLNYPSWQNYSIVKPISGKPGKEGEVVLLNKVEEGFAFPAYYARTIKLDPPHQVIWKTYPEEIVDGIDFFGFVEFRLRQAQGRTLFWRQTIYEFLVPHEQETELEVFAKHRYENSLAMQASIYAKLQKLVDAGN